MNASGGVFSPLHRALSVGILLSVTAIACEGMAVTTILPTAAFELGGLEAYGWSFSAFMLASLVGAISGGRAADRHDPCAPARLGFVVFSIGLVVSGVAPSWAVLLLGRVLQGFGAGNLGAIAYVAVARGYPESLRPRLLALLSSAWVLPALLGPAVAGQVAERASWRLVFIGILPAMAVAAWMLLPSLARVAQYSRPDLTAGAIDVERRPGGPVFTAIRLAAGVGLVLLAADAQSLLVAADLALLTPAMARAAPGLAVAALLGITGVVLAAPALRTLLPVGTFSGGTGLPAAVAIRGLLAFGFFGSEALIPLGLSTQRNLPPSLVGLSLTTGALAWVLGAWIQDRAESRSGGSLSQRAMRVAGGLVLIAAGIGGVATVVLSPSLPTELSVASWTVAGLGMGLAYPGSTLTALGSAPGGQEGAAAAALQVAETVGIALGTGAAGALFALAVHLQRATSDGLAWGFVLTVGAVVLALLPAARLAPSGPHAWLDPTTSKPAA